VCKYYKIYKNNSACIKILIHSEFHPFIFKGTIFWLYFKCIILCKVYIILKILVTKIRDTGMIQLKESDRKKNGKCK